MNIYVHLSFFFILLNSIVSVHAIPGIIYYNDLLTITLLQNVTHFIEVTKKREDKAFKDALEDMIKLAPQNETNISKILKDITENLQSRIHEIERLKNKSIDCRSIALGAGLIAASAAMCYAIYYVYKKWYVPNCLEYDAIKKSFEKNGIKISEFFNEIRITLPSRQTQYNYNNAKRLAEITNTCDNILQGLFMASVIPMFSAFTGACGIMAGLKPQHDDENLEKYLSMLAITQEFQKSINF